MALYAICPSTKCPKMAACFRSVENNGVLLPTQEMLVLGPTGNARVTQDNNCTYFYPKTHFAPAAPAPLAEATHLAAELVAEHAAAPVVAAAEALVAALEPTPTPTHTA